MINIYILLFMFFCHVIDDFCLQGILASMKQKKWWKENAPEKMYKDDYIIALIVHSFSWSFMIHLPIMINTAFTEKWIPISILINLCIHAFVDDLKANRYKINLEVDQYIHYIQICIVWLLYLFMQ